MPDLKIFFWIAASVADTAAFYHNGTKTILANALSTFFIKDLPRNCPDCTIVDSQGIENFILADENFAKALESLKLTY